MTRADGIRRETAASGPARLPWHGWITVFLVAALTAPLPWCLVVVLANIPPAPGEAGALVAAAAIAFLLAFIGTAPVALGWAIASALLTRKRPRTGTGLLVALAAALPAGIHLARSGGALDPGAVFGAYLLAANGAIAALAGLAAAIRLHGRGA